MASENPTGWEPDDDVALPRDEDAKTEGAVLGFVLEQHPDHLSIPELARVFHDPGDFSNDATERAVRELVGAGLLCCHRGLVRPTRAALYFARLEVA